MRVVPHVYAGDGPPVPEAPRWNLHSLQISLAGEPRPAWCVNTVRLGGEPSLLFDRALGPRRVFPRNFAADATFDEFYLWTSSRSGIRGIRSLWRRGRYYRPDDADSSDDWYSRAPLTLSPLRQLPARCAARTIFRRSQPLHLSSSVHLRSGQARGHLGRSRSSFRKKCEHYHVTAIRLRFPRSIVSVSIVSVSIASGSRAR